MYKLFVVETLIREYNSSDKDACLIAFKSNVPLYFTIEEISEFESFLENFNAQIINGKYFEKTYYYVIANYDQVIGCGGFGFNEKTNVATLAWGLVNKAFHKKGVGEKLLAFRIQQMQKLYPTATIVVDTTQFSYLFFERYGFVTTKVTPDFYTLGMDRYDMTFRE